MGEGFSSLQMTRRTYFFRFPSAGYFVWYFRDYYGPKLKAFEAFESKGREVLARGLEGMFEEWNRRCAANFAFRVLGCSLVPASS